MQIKQLPVSDVTEEKRVCHFPKFGINLPPHIDESSFTCIYFQLPNAWGQIKARAQGTGYAFIGVGFHALTDLDICKQTHCICICHSGNGAGVTAR